MKYDTCPDIEELSAWTDNESQQDYSEHCKKCDECREIAQDFRKLDQTLESIIAVPQATKDFAAKISDSCNKPPIRKFNFVRQFSRVAAVLVAAVVISKFYKAGDNINTASSTTPSTVTTDDFNTNNIDQAITHNNDTGSIPADIRLVSTDSKKSTSTTSALEENIMHSWISENPALISDLIIEAAPNANILSKVFDAKGNCTLEVQLSDKMLLKVVNHLSKAGHSLLSPNFPQPGNNDSVSIKGKQVTYKVTINKKVK